MNDSTSKPSPSSRRSGIRRWPRPLIFCGALIALVAAFYVEEDWRGRRDWNQYRKAVEARGDHLEFQAYIPKPVPDGENFAAAEIVKPWSQVYASAIFPNDLYSRADHYVWPTNTIKQPGHRDFEDLVAWQMASDALQDGPLDSHQKFATDKRDLASREQAAQVILEGMKPDEADFTALRLASARPYSQFPLEYNSEDPADIKYVHLTRVRQASQHLSLQACAELAAGQSDKALADVKLLLALTDSIKADPLMISYLLRVALFQINMQPVWEGLAEHRWTESQLPELESRFQHYDFLADLDHSLKTERAWGIRELDYVKKKGLGKLDSDSTNYSSGIDYFQKAWPRGFLNVIGRLAPEGWYDFERLNSCALYDAQSEGVMDLAVGRVFPNRAVLNSAEVSRQLPSDGTSKSVEFIFFHKAFVSEGDLGLVANECRIAATAQVTADQAAIACALERYRLANGQFPDKLEALAPQFISHPPNDVMTGQPYKYRRTNDGQFVLYSVGWNLKDDGGVPGKRLFDDKEGDWVWDYPAQ